MRSRSVIAIAAIVIPATGTAQQQVATAAPPACAGPEFRTLDFWVGEWIAEDQQANAIGTNRITRDEYGNCVITEHFRMNDGSLTGHSVSIYLPKFKQWRQTWVDNQNGYFDLVGGPVSGGDHVFVF